MKKAPAIIVVLLAIGLFWFFSTQTSHESISDSMTFFITSQNPGNGGDLGGLEGADTYCQTLAEAAGAGDQQWKAYLSGVNAQGETENARDRIGEGPWHNADGVLIANSVDELHNSPTINKANALDENGEVILGRGDEVNRHDILTGSQPDGTAFTGEEDTTCANWTSSDEGSAFVGHHDRMGLDDSDSAKSWNSSHGSRGCSLENLQGTGGDGLFYCFAS